MSSPLITPCIALCGGEVQPQILPNMNEHRSDTNARKNRNSTMSSIPVRPDHEHFQTLQNHDLGAEIPGVSEGLLIPTKPLRPPRAQNPVSKALLSHSDPT